jgi:nicotinate-nucleotide--dimethylbenzimidazole phosphoribosyltransferase
LPGLARRCTSPSRRPSRFPALQARIDGKTKPPGSLGQLERLALQIGQLQQSLTPTLGNRAAAGLRRRSRRRPAGVSAYPQEVTWQMVENFLAGGAAINVFARHNGLQLQVIDAGVAHDFGVRDGLVDAKVAFGTNNFIEQPAMSERRAARRPGARRRDRSPTRRRGLQGDRFRRNGHRQHRCRRAAYPSAHRHATCPTASAAAPASTTPDWHANRHCWHRAAARAALPPDASALSVLAEFGGFEIAMMAGAMLAAAERGMLLLIDGFIVTSALLVAAAIAPAIRDYCVFCHRSAEPGHQAQLRALHAEPLARSRPAPRRRNRRRAGLAAGPRAAAFLNEMASFESAGVSEQA